MERIARSSPSNTASHPPSRRAARPSRGALRCRRKFLRLFPKGFYDEDYVALERDYKWAAHERWSERLDRRSYRLLLTKGAFAEIAARAAAIEGRTNLIFSYEKMAMRDALKTPDGARAFAEGLYDLLYGPAKLPQRFQRWCGAVAALPRKQSRVLTWPNVTVFGFIAQPETHFFLKPTVTRRAAEEYGTAFDYRSRPSWESYASLLDFCEQVRTDLADLKPRDMIDIQSFLWIQGSDEYEE
jgi:hypothetical protein